MNEHQKVFYLNCVKTSIHTIYQVQATLLSGSFVGQKWKILRYDLSDCLSIKLPAKGKLPFCHGTQARWFDVTFESVTETVCGELEVEV